MEPPIFQEFRSLLPGTPFTKLPRYEFYEEVASDDTCLVIATGEKRIFANILLCMGVVS